MTIFSSADERAECAAMYDDEIQRVLYDEPIGFVDTLERRALLTCLPVLHPAVPVESARLFAETLERRADGVAAGALAVYARFASSPLAEAAAGALARLDVAGVVSPWREQIGTLRMRSATRATVPGARATFYLLELERDSAPERWQVLTAGITHDPCGPVLQMVSFSEHDPAPHVTSGLLAGEPIDRDELEADLRAALAHMLEDDHALFEFMIGDLLMLDLVVTGRPGSLPRPLLLPLWEEESRAFLAGVSACESMRADGVDPADDAARDLWLAMQRRKARDQRRRARRRRRVRR